jgi:ketosteroid isomerase-like protein
MKLILLTLFLSSVLFAGNTSRRVFENFHTAYQKGDFNELDKILSDDFIAIDENGQIVSHKKDYLAYLKQWSKTFNTEWNVSDIVEKKDTIFSTEFDKDIFADYLYNGNFKLRYTYIFSNNQISSMRWDTLPGYAEKKQIFDYKYSLFYGWTSKNHPDKLIYFNKTNAIAAEEIKAMLEEYISTLNNKT